MSIKNELPVVLRQDAIKELGDIRQTVDSKWTQNTVTVLSVLVSFFIALGINVTGIFETFNESNLASQQAQLQAKVQLEQDKLTNEFSLERTALDGLLAANSSFNEQILQLSKSLDEVLKDNSALVSKNLALQNQVLSLERSVETLTREIDNQKKQIEILERLITSNSDEQSVTPNILN